MPALSREQMLKLQEELGVLRAHFDHCEGAKDPEVLDWARFFLRWSQAAGKTGEEWARTNLMAAEKIAKDLEKSKTGTDAFGALQAAMREAAVQMARTLRVMDVKPFPILRATPEGFLDDLDAPKARYAG